MADISNAYADGPAFYSVFMPVSAPMNLRSMPRLAADLRVPFPLLLRIVRVHGVGPTVMLDGQPWFGVDAAERIRKLAELEPTETHS